MDKQSTGTILELLENGVSSHPAIVSPNGPSITYDSLRKQVRDLSKQLAQLGIGKNDRVAIVLPNSVESVVCFLAVAATATAAPLNPAYKEEEFRFYMEDTKAKALITSAETGASARDATAPSVLNLSVNLDNEGRTLLTHSHQKAHRTNVENPTGDDVALILHTSGTTSRPKRVPLSNRNLTVSAYNIVNTYELSSEDTSLCVMPLFHVHGIVASTLSTLISGGTIIVPSRFNALNFWPTVRNNRVTWFSAVPSMHQALLNRAHRNSEKETVYDGLRFIRSCSAALPANIMMEMEQTFGVPMLEAYGMTEAAHQMTSNPLPPRVRIPGTVGTGTGVTVGIMDEDGGLQSINTQGEVVIQGPNVINGYEDNPDANATSFSNGWFRTGDQGSLNQNNVLTLTGRIKELINRSGEKISPVEIDEVLLSHPAVSESVAFGIPHRTHGEEPAAAVVINTEISEKELISHCRDYLADFKCPRNIHIVDSIPRTATGKVQRRVVASTILGTL